MRNRCRCSCCSLNFCILRHTHRVKWKKHPLIWYLGNTRSTADINRDIVDNSKSTTILDGMSLSTDVFNVSKIFVYVFLRRLLRKMYTNGNTAIHETVSSVQWIKNDRNYFIGTKVPPVNQVWHALRIFRFAFVAKIRILSSLTEW